MSTSVTFHLPTSTSAHPMDESSSFEESEEKVDDLYATLKALQHAEEFLDIQVRSAV